MSAKRICIKKEQQTSDDGDKVQKVVINSLDYDSLAEIIMLLPIPERIDIEGVCTKWKEACQLAWYDIKKYKCELSIGRSYDNRLLAQSYLKKILLRCGKYLKELSLSKAFNSSIMPFIGDRCKNLTTLECKFDNDSLIDNADHFVQAFTQLDKLKCIKITVDQRYSHYESNNFSAIIDSLPEEINEIHLFSEPRWQLKRNISMTLQRFKNLKKLTLYSFHLDNIILQEIADITTLVHLDIAIYDIHENLYLFNKLVNLEYIDLTMGAEYEMKNFSTKVLNTIFSTCKNLKHLDIPYGPYDVTKIPLKKWINFQNLQHLGICCSIMPDLVNTIVEYCKNLKHLRMYNHHDITMNNTALKKLTELKDLECLRLVDRHKLHNETITAISNNCKKLKRLEITHCIIEPAIDDDSLSSPSVLDELSKLRYLEYLILSNTKNLDDKSMIAIANNCKNLKTLKIPGCTGITQTALDALTNLENLQKLDVRHLDIITDSFIIKLKGLKELNCSYCRKLTNSGIIQFIKNNPVLEIISIYNIKNITIDMVIAADEATKNRTNGIILQIRAFPQLMRRVSKSIIKSQWLVVDCS